jgi:hypothetical protein
MSDEQKLISIIDQEAAVIESLIAVMKNKQKAIIAMSIENLRSTIAEELKLVSLTKSLEKQRIELLKRFLPKSLRPEDITLSQIIKEVSENDRKILSKLREKFRYTLNEIKKTNDLNKLLIIRGKKFIRENIAILTCNGERQIIDKKI